MHAFVHLLPLLPPPSPSLLPPSLQFPHANVALILSKLRGPVQAQLAAIKERFHKADPSGSGHLEYSTFHRLVGSLSQGLLNEHEIMTLGRHFGEKKVCCVEGRACTCCAMQQYFLIMSMHPLRAVPSYVLLMVLVVKPH